MSPHYDAIIIGAGRAGPPLAERPGKAGLKTLLIERHLLGGTSVNVGCIPTKTRIGSARVAWLARQASEFGIEIVAANLLDDDSRRVCDRIPCYGPCLLILRWVGSD